MCSKIVNDIIHMAASTSCNQFAGDDNQGLFGLELSLDMYLKGTDGKILTELDVAGTELPFAFESRIEAIDGYDVITTLNTDIQRIAEKIVEQAIEANKSEDGAVCIVSNSKTSEILQWYPVLI